MLNASLAKRMASLIYEGLLLFAVVALSALVFGYATHSTHALTHRTGLQILLLGVMSVYFIGFWIKGQTLAMKTWRIQVTDAHGRPLKWQRSALRYALSWLWVFPPLVTLYVSGSQLSKSTLYGTFLAWLGLYIFLAWRHPSKQFLHDRLAGTRLVTVAP